MKKMIQGLLLSCVALMISCVVPCGCQSQTGCGCACDCANETKVTEKRPKPSQEEAIARLKAGNQRFLHNQPRNFQLDKDYIKFLKEADQGDYAYATIISCSDSRVPVERIFDACFMELFVIRVAGNVFQSAELGSAEYGIFHVKTPVLVVLGHTECGAVSAVVDECMGHHHKVERNVKKMIEPIVKPTKKVITDYPNACPSELKRKAVTANVKNSIYTLLDESDDIREAVKKGKCTVVGAVYDMDTDEVQFMPFSETEKILAEVERDDD